MAHQGRDNDEQPAPATRDGKGRFTGCGNRRGRPRKVKPVQAPEPTSLGGYIMAALAEKMPVEVKGASKLMSKAQILIHKLIADALTGTPADRARLLRMLATHGGANLKGEAEEYKQQQVDAALGQGWTEELEEQYRIVADEYELDGRDAETRGLGDGGTAPATSSP